MAQMANKRTHHRIFSVFLQSSFYLLIFLYYWRVVDPTLVYGAQRPVFFYQLSFLQQFFSYPGGLIQVFGAFITQFFTASWVGALLMTLTIFFLARTIRKILQIVSAAPLTNLVEWVIVAPVAALQASYLFPIAHTMALLVLLLAFLFYLKIAVRFGRLELPMFFLFSAVLYYLIAAYALAFALFCTVFFKRSKTATPVYGATFGVFMYIIPQLFYQILVFDPTTLYTYPLPLTLDFRLKLIFSVFGLLLFGFMFFCRFRRSPLKTKNRKSSPALLKLPAVAMAYIALFLMFGFFYLAFDAKYRVVLRVNSFAEKRQWPSVLSMLKEHEEINHRLTNLQLYRALYLTDQLGEKLFEFPVGEHADGLYRSDQLSFTFPIEYCDLLIDLGNVNGAQHKAYEAWAVEGETPRVLQHLAFVHMAKKEYTAAEKYLKKLQLTLKFTDWTLSQLRMCREKIIGGGLELARSPLLQDSSAFLLRPGFAHAELKQLVQSQPQNRIAVEYLLAYDLLSGHLDYFMENLPCFQQFTQELPRAFEEAVILYLSSGLPVSEKQQSIPVRRQTVSSFSDFMRILQKHGNDKLGAYNDLMQKFSDTFWFYYLYHKPGDTN